MHLLVGDARTRDAGGFQLCVEHYLVDGLLTLIELAAHGDGTCDVGAVVHGRLAAGVHHQHAAHLQPVVVAVVVQRLAVDGHDDGEAHGTVALPGLALHEARQLVLVAARHGHLHGADMHVVGRGDGLLDLRNLLGTLDHALLHAGQDELHRGEAVHRAVVYAYQVGHLGTYVGAVGGQEVGHRLAVDGRLHGGNHVAQHLRRAGVLHTHRGGQLFHARQRARPDDVIDIIILGEDIVLACLAVEHANQVLALQAEEIQERTVLAEPVGIVFVVARRLVVARHDNQAVAHVLAQLLTPRDVSLFVEHINAFLLISILHITTIGIF